MRDFIYWQANECIAWHRILDSLCFLKLVWRDYLYDKVFVVATKIYQPNEDLKILAGCRY